MNHRPAGPPETARGGDRSETSGQAPGEEGQSPGFLSWLFRRHEEPEEPAPPEGGGNPTGQIVINLREMRRKRVDDVAIPRADIVAVPDDIDPHALVAVFRETTLTRLPVYHETLDDPLGFVHFKDLALKHGFGNGLENMDLRSLIRPMLYVPASMPLIALLQKMQRERCHMALVIDEYGGVDGLVTFEDLVEQIVGEIEDEHDTADPVPWRQEAPGVWLTHARAELADFEAATGVSLRPPDVDEEIDTLGGLVFLLTGRIPERGEVIRHSDGHEFEVVDADARRIKRLRVRLKGPMALGRAAE
ncbi:MAG: conjugation transfer protein [Paracoccaceae bacterium]|nr:MAG: conjugation transfer protein [Paracoccaceae bacterium]